MERPIPSRDPAGPAASGGSFCARVLALAAGLAVAWTPAVAAQQAGTAAGGAGGDARALRLAPASIPVVERFDPATGRRSRRTVSDLTTDQVLSLQRALARAGRDPGVRSGVLDTATRSALSAFQRQRGLPACGCPSYATVLALGLEPRVVETVVASGGRQPGFAHPTAGPAEAVSVSREAGVVVVRGTGSGSADGRTGRMPVPASTGAGGAAAAGPEPASGAASRPPWPGYGEYFEPLYGVWLLPGGRGPARGGRGGRPGHERAGGAEGGAHARPPIPYAPRLPEPRPAAPGLPPSPPPAPKSGGGGS